MTPHAGRRLAASVAASGAVWLAACAAGSGPTAPIDSPPRLAGAPSPARVALVLSGGSLRGFAHVGVLRALEAEGLRPDLVVGSSAGALVGALHAAGLDAGRIAAGAREADFDPWTQWLSTRSGRNERFEAFARAVLPRTRIEDFPVRFAAVATDLDRGCSTLFTAGDAARAVLASSALPGLFAPVVIAGRSHGDGGLAAPLPVRAARALGARRVIAVDVTFHAERQAAYGPIDAMFHAGMVMARGLAAPERDAADVLIVPALPPVRDVTIANRTAIIDAGERAAREAMPKLRALFDAADAAPAAGTPGAHERGWTHCGDALDTVTAGR